MKLLSTGSRLALLSLALTFVTSVGTTDAQAAGPSTSDGLQPYYPEMNVNRTKLLSPEELAQELATLPGWEGKDGMLGKIYAFSTFSDAVAFIVRISHPLEAMDHHPEIRNVYGKVYLGFTTHDQGNRITNLDVKAARVVEEIAAKLPQKTS